MIALRLKSSSLFLFIGIVAVILMLLVFPVTVLAQELETKEEPVFVHSGVVAFDPNYQVPESRNFIVFHIRNDGFRTISNIFGWVYRYREGPEGPTDFNLMNNPHQSASLVQGGPHRAGAVAQWRFILQNTTPLQADEKFTLRVSPKSVFYRNLEPPLPPKEKGNP
jgi:hypothetical protein